MRLCSTCRTPFTPANRTQRFCSEPCRTRLIGPPPPRKNKQGRRKPPTLTTTQRGYGSQHQRHREHWAPQVEAGRVYCWRCHKPITPGTPWDLGHDDNDRTRYQGPEHRTCNRRAGQAKATTNRTRTQRPGRPPQTSTTLQW